MLGCHVLVFQPAIRVYRTVGKRPVEEGHSGADGSGEAACVEEESDPNECSEAEPEQPRLVSVFGITVGFYWHLLKRVIVYRVAMEASVVFHSPNTGRTRSKIALWMARLLAAAAVAGLLGCAQKNESQEDASEEGHALLGVVQGVDSEETTLTVAHEDIPGVMPPMTMVFRVGPGDVKVFEKGDQIKARMVRDEDGGFRLVKIWKIDDAAADEMRKINEKLTKQVDTLGSGYYFGEGDAFPDFALVDQYNKSVTPAQYAGKPFILNFIFTRCTDGEMCPLSTSKMAMMQRKAKEMGLEDLQFISVTLDPQFDTPGVLRQYADAYGIDGANFRFVTGERIAVRQLVKSMALTRIQTDEDIIHSLATVLVDRDRKIVMRSTTKKWDPEAFLEAAAKL